MKKIIKSTKPLILHRVDSIHKSVKTRRLKVFNGKSDTVVLELILTGDNDFNFTPGIYMTKGLSYEGNRRGYRFRVQDEKGYRTY